MRSFLTNARRAADAFRHAAWLKSGGKIRQLVDHDFWTSRSYRSRQRRCIEHVDHNGCSARGLKPSRFALRARRSENFISRIDKQRHEPLADRSGCTSEKNLTIHKMSSCENKM
jgi:hypothetical protein